MNQQEGQDLVRDYNDTYVMYDGALAYLHHMQYVALNPTDGHVKASVWRGRKAKEKNVVLDEDKIQQIVVRSSLFNHFVNSEEFGGPVCAAFSIRRRPRRQWQQGMCSNNTTITQPLVSLFPRSNLLNYLGLGGNNFPFELVESAVNPKYMSVEEAVSALPKYYSIAVSPDFCLSLSPKKDNPNILIQSCQGFIGDLKDKTVRVFHPVSAQEVRDFFKGYEVVNA